MQTVTCDDTVKDHIVQSAQKSFCKWTRHCRVTVRDLQKKDPDSERPVRGQSVVTRALKNSKEQAGMDAAFQDKLERFLARKEQLDQSTSKARSLIFSQCCNETMQSRIEERSDCETLI